MAGFVKRLGQAFFHGRKPSGDEAPESAPAGLPKIISMPPEARLIIDRPGNVHQFNKPALAMFGWQKDAPPGNINELLEGASLSRLQQGIEAVFANENADRQLAVRGNEADGHVIITIQPLPDVKGGPFLVLRLTAVNASTLAEMGIAEPSAPPDVLHLMQEIFDLNKDFVIVSEPNNGKVLFVNRSAVDFSGLPKQEWVGERAGDLPIWINRDEQLKLRDLMSVHGGRVENFETILNAGEYGPVPVRINSLMLNVGGRDLIVTIGQDMRELKQFKAESTRSTTLLASIFELAPDMMVIIDQNGSKLVDANPRFLETHGVHLEDIKGKHVRDLNLTLDPADIELVLKDVMDHGGVENRVVKSSRPDGSEFRVSVFGSLINAGDENFILLIGRDISEKLRMEAAHERSERLFSKVFQTSPDVITINQLETGLFIDCNEKIVELFGYERGEVLGRTANDLNLWVDPDEFKQFRALLVQDGSVPYFEARFRRKSGEIWDGAVAASLVEINNDKYFIIIGRDITEQKRQSEKLRRSAQNAEYASRAKSDFLANMSHELRTPLNAILGFSEAIKAQLFGAVGNDKYIEYADHIHTSGHHLLHIINDILDLSKVEAGKVEITLDHISLKHLFDQCVNIVAERAREAGLVINMKSDASDPSIIADALRMKQVLLNLLSNAVKFTPAGGQIEIGSEILRDGRCRIYVSDSGVGMTPEEIDQALSPFGQIGSSMTRNHEGAGLGLPLVVALTELQGAQFSIDSAPGDGTTISVVFPQDKLVFPSEDLTRIPG